MTDIERPYHIGIVGSYGGLNLGDEAILAGIIRELRQSVPAEITVFSRNAADTVKRHSIERAVSIRKLTRSEAELEVRRLDLLLLGGGGILFDGEARFFLREVELALEHDIPVMIYAVGAGPLKDPGAQRMVRDCICGADLVTVRERRAQQILEEVGVHRDIVVTADPGLLLQPEPLPEDLIPRLRSGPSKNLIALSVREPGAAAPDMNVEHYHNLIANAADYMVDRYDADIVFLPMERNVLDLQHSHAVVSKMLRPQCAHVLNEDLTSGQLLSLMQHLQFALGMRLHFLIFAALQRVPFVALPYASKVAGFIEELHMDMPPLHLVNAGRLLAHIDYSWDTRDQIRSQIDRWLLTLQERARETNRLAIDLLKRLRTSRRKTA